MDTLAPAGWYADNTGRGLRYWDGTDWTSHLILVAPQAADPA